MTTIVTGVRLQVENGAKFVGDLKEVRGAISGIASAEDAASAGARELSGATSNAAASASVAAAELVHAAAAANQLSGAAGAAANSASLVAAEMSHAAAASGQLSTATAGVTSAASVAAAEMTHAAQAANDNAIGLLKASGAATQYASMAAQLRSELDPMFAVQQRYDQELARADTLLEAGAISEREFAAAVKLANDNLRAGHSAIFQNSGAQESLNRNLGLQRAGWQGVGFQLQDVFASYASGIALTTIFAQQSGQMTSSLAMIAQGSDNAGGKMSGFASFMGGPWGIAIGVAVSVIGALAVAFLDAGDKADSLGSKSLSLSDALDKTRFATKEAQKALADYNAEQGRARSSTEAMIKIDLAAADAALQAAIATREKLKATLESERSSNLPGASPGYAGYQGSPTVAVARERLDENVAGIAALMAARRNLRIRDAVRDASAAADPLKAINNRYDDMAEAAKRAAAGNDALSRSLKGTLTDIEKRRASDLKAEQQSGRTKRTPADQTARRAEYGEDVGKKIAGIRDQFSDLPSTVTRANTAMRELDDIASDLAARPLTPNVKALAEELGRVRTAVQESLNRPFNEYLEQAREAAEIDALLLQGRDDEARALQLILGLKEKQGALDDEQVKAVLATVQGERERAAVLRDQRALISANVAAVQDFRGALEDTVADALRGRFSVDRVLSSIGNSYVNIVSQRFVEGMFGDTLRQLEAQATGADKVDAAGTRIATSLDSGAEAVTDFASTLRSAITAIEAARTAASSASASPTNLLDQIVGGMAEGSGVPEATGDEIVVTANRPKKVDVSGTGAMLIEVVNQSMRRLGIEMPKVVTDSLKGVFNRLEQSLPNALQGAFTGAAASKIILGNGGSGVGGAIGGAIGQKMGEKFLSSGLEKVGGKLLGSFAGPLGGIVGGVLGGVLGGLFKSTKTGGASIGLDAKGNAGITGTGGNSADLKKTASGYAGTVVSALDQIAQALGADLGQFNVAIGKRSSGYIKVSSTGNVAATTAKKPGSDIIYDGKDEGEAIMAALADAIGDGAIAGVSAAVQKALTSSTDVDKALKEALKVQDVELALGGVGAQLAKEFRAFEQQAKDRVRIAREYGFDVLQMEERNAADRLKLQEKLLRDQVGGLQDLIAEMTAGSLFEGSAIDQRDALLEEIEKARQQAAAGEDGAADKLAQLLQKLNEVSKEAFGTTGGFAADRATILATAQAEVARAKQEIEKAQATSDPALSETNSQLSEANDQLARLASLMGVSAEYLQAMAQQWNFAGFDNLSSRLGDLARTS